MLEILPQEIRDGLDAARRRADRRRSRIRVQVGDAVFPVLRLWDEGMTLDAGLTPHLRGHVDVFDGARHLFRALIVASTTENGELVCEFKRATAVADRAPLDFCVEDDAPVALLPRG
ncbi:MAG: hypothetical protein KF887_19480 [Paracoccaceae bacterium]|nr:MAG: hypothetical protein KF887_19480 [Paracoccaceae bacterium]